MRQSKAGLLPTILKESNLKEDLLCHDEKIEWWFVQGFFEGRSSERHHFMCALFRQRYARNKYGFALIQALFNRKSKLSQSYVQIDKDEVNLFLAIKKIMQQSNLYAPFALSFLDEIKRYGPPEPIVLEKSKANVRSSPFGIAWKDFALRQRNGAMALSFSMPGQKKGASFCLSPGDFCLSSGIQSAAEGEKSMKYISYPRMSLKGSFEGKPVSGQAWFDHQWGGYGWFSTNPRGGTVLGWDWLGVNLSDGSDMIIMLQRDMKSRKVIQKQAVWHKKGDGRIYTTTQITAEPVRFWQSSKTRIQYPVEWRFSIPAFEATFTFEPFSDEQEIKLFNFLRAVWDGAGTVRGRVGKNKVMGSAWLELQGYGFIFDFQSYLDKYTQSIDSNIEWFIPKQISESDLHRYIGPCVWKRDPHTHTEMLSKPVWDLLSREGKRWRPIFCLLMLESLGVDSKQYELLASVIAELSHNGALIIDDIEDNSRIRRNDICIHRRYGVDVAINAGNILYFIPYLLIKDYPGLTKEQQLKIFHIMICAMIRSHFGQSQDLYWSRNSSYENLSKWIRNNPEDELFEMYLYKTGALLEGVAEFCAVIAQADNKTRMSLVRFAQAFGVAFQIMDDVNNFSQSPKWTKVCGEDVASGKLTYPVVTALKRLSGEKQNRLKRIITDKTLRTKRKTAAEAIRLIRSSGALEECRAQARKMLEKEWRDFSRHIRCSEPKIMLRMMCTGLLNIPYKTTQWERDV